MRIESSVTSLSWIPSEAVRGMPRLPFDLGVTHYDTTPPDAIEDLEELRRADRFRFANELRAWIEVDNGTIVGHGQLGGGWMGSTRVQLRSTKMIFEAVAFPDLRPPPDVSANSVRFVQTAGGRPGLPAPRRVRRKPYFQLAGPTVWSTLALTIHTDGTSAYEVVGASPFPRHWIYDKDGRLAAKSGMTDFKDWYRRAFGSHSPWGDEDSAALVTVAETALERELSTSIMRAGAKPKILRLAKGKTLVEQGQPGGELYLLLDGVIGVEIDGERLAELGPGAILGERALLEEGRRTSTLRAMTPVSVAVAAPDQLDPTALREVATSHHREESRESNA